MVFVPDTSGKNSKRRSAKPRPAPATRLFAAVVAAEYDRLARQIDEASSGATDPLERLVEGGDGFIAAASDPVSQRLLLIDGPAILGMDALLSADKATTTQSLQDGIEAAQVAGRLPKDISAAALTSLMSGAYDRAVLDGFGATPKARLAIRHAIREMWFGLSRRA